MPGASRDLAGTIVETLHRVRTEHGQTIEVTTDDDGMVILRAAGGSPIYLTEAEANSLSTIFQRAALDA